MKLTLEDLEKCQREFLTTGEVIEFLGVSRSTFYKYAETFPFRVEKVGSKMLVPKRDFIDFVKNKKADE